MTRLSTAASAATRPRACRIAIVARELRPNDWQIAEAPADLDALVAVEDRSQRLVQRRDGVQWSTRVRFSDVGVRQKADRSVYRSPAEQRLVMANPAGPHVFIRLQPLRFDCR